MQMDDAGYILGRLQEAAWGAPFCTHALGFGLTLETCVVVPSQGGSGRAESQQEPNTQGVGRGAE